MWVCSHVNFKEIGSTSIILTKVSYRYRLYFYTLKENRRMRYYSIYRCGNTSSKWLTNKILSNRSIFQIVNKFFYVKQGKFWQEKRRGSIIVPKDLVTMIQMEYHNWGEKIENQNIITPFASRSKMFKIERRYIIVYLKTKEKKSFLKKPIKFYEGTNYHLNTRFKYLSWW